MKDFLVNLRRWIELYFGKQLDHLLLIFVLLHRLSYSYVAKSTFQPSPACSWRSLSLSLTYLKVSFNFFAHNFLFYYSLFISFSKNFFCFFFKEIILYFSITSFSFFFKKQILISFFLNLAILKTKHYLFIYLLIGHCRHRFPRPSLTSLNLDLINPNHGG